MRRYEPIYPTRIVLTLRADPEISVAYGAEVEGLGGYVRDDGYTPSGTHWVSLPLHEAGIELANKLIHSFPHSRETAIEFCDLRGVRAYVPEELHEVPVDHTVAEPVQTARAEWDHRIESGIANGLIERVPRPMTLSEIRMDRIERLTTMIRTLDAKRAKLDTELHALLSQAADEGEKG